MKKQIKLGSEEKTTINHLDQEFTTSHFSNITDEECSKIKKLFFKKPDIQSVKKELYKIHFKNSYKISKVIDYYFSDLMNNAKLYTSKWSINEFFESNDLIRFAVGKVENCSNFYPPENDIVTNIKAVLRLSPSNTSAKISNYPIKSVKEILKKYPSKNYYDYSCGWGVRMLGALASSSNYYGTDPNYELTEKLNELGNTYNKVNNIDAFFKIYTQGSEIFIPEIENKIDIAFSSPPYFDLEDYKIGEQSIKDRNYNQWLEEYWRETVKNIYKYLTPQGLLLLNIKSFEKYNLLEDMRDICISENFIYTESLELKNIQRIHLIKNNKSTNEQILVFKKDTYIETDLEDLSDW